ncbi:Single strand annealing-weakened 1 [Metschnikowia aff. pulcherrima]|uniref:Single strand annealing-weakened 1 n=1 Tax=Metschnikowia aff. pulcherrima TaxID=2163413 RepID=A0A4P6XJ24_9ASCO|nr:Single strand annealing-weakened 1 [Metschnikowia aff. pulcherrima]
MPATITYLSVAPNTAIPVRVFVNRKKLLLLSAVAVNEKSIIKLSSINLIRLSNFDLTNLILDLGTQLQKLLLGTRLVELFPHRTVLRSAKSVTELSHTWKCKVVVSLGYLADLRYKLSCLETDDIRFLEDKKIEIDQREAAGSALLQRNIKFDFVKYEFASDDELSQLDEKKAISYKLHGQRLLNNKVIDPLDLYVTHRPRS